MKAIEEVLEIPRREFCGSNKTPSMVQAKEVLILLGRLRGASVKRLSETVGLNSSTVSRRGDAARMKLRDNEAFRRLVARISKRLHRSTG